MKRHYKRFLSLMLALLLVLSNVPAMAFAEDVAPVEPVVDATEKTLPDAEVTKMDPLTLTAEEHDVWDGSSLSDGTVERPLQAVMNFKANDTLEQAKAGGYGDWKCDFYLKFDGMEGESISGAGSYLAGKYGEEGAFADLGWIVIPTDGLTVEEGVEYPVVSNYDANLTYENVCDYVTEFTAALYVNPEVLKANPDLEVTLALKMTSPDGTETLVCGEYVYKVPELLNLPDATVEVLDPLTLAADEHDVWNGSLSDGTVARPLQAVMNFKANDTLEEAQASSYGKWKCDFYLKFDGMEGNSISGDGSYLAGKYGKEGAFADLGWIVIPTDGMTVEEGVEYPVVSNYDANLTYENICDYVKEFTAALYVNTEVLKANPDMTVTLSLKMTNPDDPDDVIIIGEPAVFAFDDLCPPPDATVTVLDPLTLAADEHDVWNGSLSDGDKDRPLQAVMNFKANDTLEEAQNSIYGKWKCDFYLKFDGMEGNSVSGDGSYLAGKYGEEGAFADLGWIVIPTDGLTVEEGVEYPVVSNYDANLTYENICDYVKEFTAALYVNPKTLRANPDMTVTLSLKMTNPDNEEDVIIIGEPAVFKIDDMLTLPKATVTVLDPLTLAAEEHDVWNGSLSDGDKDRPLQAVMNFEAIDTLEEAQNGGYGKWICDFYLKFDGMEGESISGDGSYLAGKYGKEGAFADLGWIVIPTDGMTVEKGVEYPVVTNYDPNLTYENICDYVRDFTAALYVAPETLSANPDMTVTLSLKMTNPEDPDDILIIGEPAVFTFDDLAAACGYVALNKETKKFYDDVNVANAEAKDGETVILLKDVEVTMLSVLRNFDLNGHTVTAEYVTSFGNIVDNSETNEGLLKVDSDRFFVQMDNEQLPVNTEEGYRFVVVKGFNYRYKTEENKYIFQPLFEEAANDLLLAGYDVSDVDIQVYVSWVNIEGQLRSQSFSCNEENFLDIYFNSYKPATGKYGKQFALTFTNIPADLTLQVRVVSDEGVTFTSGASFAEKVEEAATTSEDININAEADQASALVPEGTKLAENATENSLALTVAELEKSQSNITLGENEVQKSVDVHIEGIAEDNTVPAIITLTKFAEEGLNEGNLKLYHVENGKTNAMIQVFDLAEVDAHNEFYYDPATGDVTMALATFSEIAVVSDTENAWNGEFDYSWYTNAVALADTENTADYTIANADQLAAFGAIVGGMNGQTQDSFSGKTVKLLADINLGDRDNANGNLIFYPIGYYYTDDKNTDGTRGDYYSTVYSFEGTFDGNGHTISNFYHNTWEIKGDYSGNYYSDAMGLFGYVVNGKVCNLTVDNFSSDGEFTPTGVIAAYAVNSTFENIAITNCNPRVYNTGNGGIVGIGGNNDDPDTYKLTFTNITIDNTNKISALWGSWDVACGGLVGMFRGAGHVYMTNCHVAAQMDVNNDVCGNYQYYWYRYAGMMVGTNVNMTTDDNGYTVPETTKFHAEGCTVHFGEWNDYYYCELVANSLASYTHDHQFSRLEQVDSVDVENMTVTVDGKETAIPTSGSCNYVVVNGEAATENAACYHFVNGEVWKHEDAGEETVDVDGDGVKETVLKEDRQHYYLPFNQLFTGYGYGVKHIPVYNGEDYAFEGITILDREVADSVEKFESDVTELPNNTEITLGQIFKEKNGVPKVKDSSVIVNVTNLEENGTVTAVFDKENSDNWEEFTLQLSSTGTVNITIQDYYFCTPTTITVNVVERTAVEKIETKFTGDFLYRVGNKNAVKLDSLFKAIDGVEIGTVSVTVEAVDSTAASGAYTPNATWTNGTIQFSGTGVVKVTITDNDYCIPTELILEVVDAVNATSTTNATANNVVLLNDCGFSSLEVSGGYALYGNGFTMTCSSDSVALDMGYSFATLENGTLDNVQIICPNFDYAALYKSNLTSSDNRSETDASGKTRYYNAKSGVMASGNSQILNSRISGGRAAVNVSGGNVVIDNSRIELGAVASVLVGAANHVTLRDVTLVQKPTASTYDSGKTLMGLSVLLLCDSEGKSAEVTIEGSFIQNAWADEEDKKYVPSTGGSVVGYVLEQTAYLHDLDGDGENESVNLGFAYLPESSNSSINKDKLTVIEDNRDNKNDVPYDYVSVTKAYVYSYKNNNGTDDSFKKESEYVPNKYSDIVTVAYSDAADGLTTGKSYGTDGWVYELNVDLDKLSGYALDFSKLSMSVNGTTVTDFKVDGNDKPANPIAVTAGGTTYKLTATVNGKECTATFKVTGTETTKASPSLVASNYDAALLVGEAGSTLTKDTWHGAAPVLDGIQIKYWSVAEKQYKTITLSDYTPTTAGKQNGTNTTWTYSPDNGDFTLTLTGGQVHSSNNVNAMPVVFNSKLYFVAATSSGLVNYGNSARTIPVTYSFKDNNGGTELTFSHTWSIECANGNTAYDYSDFCNGTSKTFTIKSSNGNICVTGDTLVALADGTQKRIDEVTYEDQLLVWNFFTGNYDTASSVIIFNHGKDNYDVLKLIFSDGTTVKVLNNHGFFDVSKNKFVFIDEKNVESYIGHKFVKTNGTETKSITLVDYETYRDYVGSYSIQSAIHNNFMVENLFSITMPAYEGWFDYFEIGEGMKYDEEKKQADIEKYGLYTYEEFADYVTYEQFIAFNGPYLKVLVGRGVVTFEQILELIETYVA